MEWLITTAIVAGSIIAIGALVLVVLIVRDGRREGDAPTPEEEMFGTLRPAEPDPPVKYEFIE